ncbi:MAG: hypothetical protein M0004_12665 [Actinomycetota bacterium]|nr:hypothetical protein [Actinomycetota bacterium]
MPNLLSTGTAFAGKFENAPTGISGEQVLPLPDTAVTVYQSDGSTLATLFADETKATTASNPVTTDNYGNLTFYANPGIYVLSYLVQGIATTQTVEVGPWYTDGAWNVYEETAAVTADSGDSVLANASSAAFAVTTPAPTAGARLLVTKTDSSANAVSITTPTGVIDGPTGITGIGTATIQLGTQGESAEIHCDGTNWHLVGGGGGGGGEVASGSRVAITTANTWQTIATYTPTAAGRFIAQVYLTVPSGGATIAVQVTYADQDGAQTLPILTSQAQAAGKWSSLPAFFDAVSGTAIDVQVQSSVITTTLATAAILEA